ncbi:hypothetical protein Tco_0189552, partial [Tanacetum coccineum]
KEIIGYSASGLKRRRYGDSDGRASSPVFIGRCAGFVGPLASSEEDVDSKPFLPELSHLVQNSKKILEVDAETLRSKCRKFKEKEAIMLATEASLKTELEALKEKLNLDNEDRSLMVTGLLPHVVKTLFSSNFFSILLADLQTNAMLVSRAQAFEEVAGIGLGSLFGSSGLSFEEEFRFAQIFRAPFSSPFANLLVQAYSRYNLPFKNVFDEIGRMPQMRYSIMGLIQLSSSSVATFATCFSLIDLFVNFSTSSFLVRCSNVNDPSLLNASAFLFGFVLMY